MLWSKKMLNHRRIWNIMEACRELPPKSKIFLELDDGFNREVEYETVSYGNDTLHFNFSITTIIGLPVSCYNEVPIEHVKRIELIYRKVIWKEGEE